MKSGAQKCKRTHNSNFKVLLQCPESWQNFLLLPSSHLLTTI